ncbi:MAG TPA: ribulose-phosphate 3-epimerase [Anaerolineaceae bacterium]
MMKNIWQAFPEGRLLAEISLWSADFTRLGAEIARIDPYADLYHIDVSDGHFVPGFLFFADLVAALRPLTKKPFHVHLMTINPLAHIEDFIQAGADIITVHAENGPLAPAALQKIHNCGASAGIALGLDVNPDSILPYLEMADLVLMMGTAMGVKGVDPSRYAYSRIGAMGEGIQKAGLQDQVKIIADGGIRDHTVPELRHAGADGVVMGSLAFKSQDLESTFRWLRSL